MRGGVWSRDAGKCLVYPHPAVSQSHLCVCSVAVKFVMLWLIVLSLDWGCGLWLSITFSIYYMLDILLSIGNVFLYEADRGESRFEYR